MSVLPRMGRTLVNGGELAYTVRGDGEPVVLIHGALADAYRPLLTEPTLTERYQVISYDRLGYGGSSPSTASRSITEQAADCRTLLRRLGIDRAHLVGHSYGGLIALQLALDAPHSVHSLALLEPSLPLVLFAAPEFGAAMARVMQRYQAGDKAGALDAFLQAACGPDYRAAFDGRLGPEAFDQAVAAVDTIFQHDLPALQSWSLTEEDAHRLTLPVLAVVGEESGPPFHEIQRVVRAWLPQADGHVLPRATHLLMVMNPPAMAAALAGFFTRHPMTVTA